ncbi:extracellular solute-binding protein [Paenibacillus athensensis]|uniref:ABC transporter substrate-binding protein n=2 Tax=Paenibacillus athensensis TaxID=1967502 RepID=A0A4Y8PYN6_9BACL|nr:extracellular solute-binding protein [Paenibacillus athensensis]
MSLGIMGGPKTPNSWAEKQLEQVLAAKLNRPVDVVPVFYPDWSQMNTKINLLMSDASQRPNILWTGDTKEYPKWIQAGLVQDITPSLQKYGKEILNYYSKNTMFYHWSPQDGGKIYRLPGDVPEAGSMTTLLRKDWLDKLGLKPPKTLDEYIEVLRAFTNKDPDGNGKKDTYGFTGDNYYRSLIPFFYAYGVDPDNFMKMPDGSVKFGSTLPQVKTVLQILQGLYKEGVIDPRMSTTANSDNTKVDEIVVSGKVGSLYRFVSYLNPTYPATLSFKANNPDGEWMAIDPVTGPDGFGADQPDPQIGWCYLLVTNTGKADDAIQVLNEMATPETFALLNYGKEGEHYKIENGEFKALINPEQANKLGLENFDWYVKRKDQANLKNTPEVMKLYEHNISTTKPMRDKIYFSKSIDRPAWDQYITDIKKVREETFWGIITGNKPLSAFDDFIAKYDKLGGKAIDEEANKMYRLEENERKQYDAWYEQQIVPYLK